MTAGVLIEPSHELTHIMQFIEVIHKLHDALRACAANDRNGESRELAFQRCATKVSRGTLGHFDGLTQD
jgi:hypothetical protein